ISVGCTTITSKRAIKYLGVWIDTRLSFREHLEATSNKAAGLNRLLSRLMANTGGPKQLRRSLIAGAMQSIAL
ncbi:hypothetical protein KR215_007185, partial [Drosophila sulfurigaster]